MNLLSALLIGGLGYVFWIAIKPDPNDQQQPAPASPPPAPPANAPTRSAILSTPSPAAVPPQQAAPEQPPVATPPPPAGPPSAPAPAEPPPAPEPPTPVSQDPTGPPLREADVFVLRCTHLDHHPDHVPTATIRRGRTAGIDINQVHANGWGSDPHTTRCRHHNPTGDRLGIGHVECGWGCGTPIELRIADPGDVDWSFGLLRERGWRSDPQDRLVCPYCAGTRSRRWR